MLRCSVVLGSCYTDYQHGDGLWHVHTAALQHAVKAQMIVREDLWTLQVVACRRAGHEQH